MERFLWVCFAGAIGTGVRYLLGVFAAERFGMAFPYATLVVNVVGCLLLAFVLEIATHAVSFSPTLRVVLATGFMGGLTTYSSFNYETVAFARNGQATLALGYFAITTVTCLVAALAGLALARSVLAS